MAATDYLTTIRASGAYLNDVAGNWFFVGPDTLRRSDRGLLVEGEASTNLLRNPRGVGAAPGVGPTNWFIKQTASGITADVIGRVTFKGIDFVRISVSGTATGSVALRFTSEANNGIAALLGQTFTHAVFSRFVAGGAFGSIAPSIELREFASGALSGGISSTAVPVSDAVTRTSHTRTLTDAPATNVQPSYRLGFTLGETYNFELWLGWPQVEQKAFASSPILPLGDTVSAATRTAETVRLVNFPGGLVAGTLFIEFELDVTTAAASQFILQMSDTTTSNRLVVYATALGVIAGLVVVNGVIVANMPSGGAVAAGSTIKAAMAWKEDDAAIIRGGGAIGTDNVLTIPALSRLELGSTMLSGRIRKVQVYPARFSNERLAEMVA